MMSVGTEGDVGDACMLLGVMQSIPDGPHKLLFQPSSVTKTGPDPSKLRDLVAPLALKQTYISEARNVQDGEPIDWNSGSFRGNGIWCPQATLLGAHAHNLVSTKGVGRNITGKEKWLHNIAPSPISKNRVICSRTGRYRNGCFPWKQIVNHYGDRLLFVGLPHEYRDFCGEFGVVEYHKTSNMLEVAEIIAGSALFIGNQSSPNAVCEGLKHPLIQETSLSIPDCIFIRPNAQHVSDGACVLPDVDDSGVLHIPSVSKDRYVFRTHVTPPEGWQYGGKRQQAWNALMLDVKRLPEFVGKEDAEIAPVLMEANWKRKPDFFKDESFPFLFHTFQQAMQSAQAIA